MKQIIQNYKSGELQIVEVPTPFLKKGFIIVKNVCSLVSGGTEKYMLEMAKKSLFGKAKARPDLVKQVISKIKAEGFMEAYKALMSRLDTSIPLGYSSAGVVLELGEGIDDFRKGDAVSCTGSGYASHAEEVSVPKNLCVKLPDNVDFEDASFVALGGISLQAVRMANPSLGSKVAVIGLGLLGQLTVQILKASGCHVFGADISKDKVKMAIKNGADEGIISGDSDILSAARSFAPQGFDSIIIMAASKTNEPLETAAEIARERAKIVATGLVDLKIPRKSFFDKELEFVVSRAWGPGVFDPLYVEKNIDYPYAYGRWTAKRNLEEFLYLVSKKKVKVKHLITHRFTIDDSLKAYELVLKGKEPYIGVIIKYPDRENMEKRERELKPLLRTIAQEKIKAEKTEKKDKVINASFIGAGLFAAGTLLPMIKSRKDIRLRGVATSTGLTAQQVAKKYGFDYFTTDYQEILNDKDVNLVFIMTRHGSHSHFICEAIKAGKNIFIEKPLCINEEQLKQITSVYNKKSKIDQKDYILMVGFNRRFSPFSKWLKEKFNGINEPLSIHITCNAGYIPPDHWVFDAEDGGGRIIGEVCHFMDLIQYLSDSNPERVYAEYIDSPAYKQSDNVSINMKMKNGTIGSILYIASGDKRFARERVEIFGGGAVGVIENFKSAVFVSHGKKKKRKNWIYIDRGYRDEIERLASSIKSGINEFLFESYWYTTKSTFAVEKSLEEGNPIEIV